MVEAQLFPPVEESGKLKRNGKSSSSSKGPMVPKATCACGDTILFFNLNLNIRDTVLFLFDIPFLINFNIISGLLNSYFKFTLLVDVYSM